MIRERRCFLYCLATALATAVLHSRLWPTPYHREADCAALAQSALVVPGMLASYSAEQCFIYCSGVAGRRRH